MNKIREKFRSILDTGAFSIVMILLYLISIIIAIIPVILILLLIKWLFF